MTHLLAHAFNLFFAMAEKEDVFSTNGVRDFDGGSIVCPHKQTAIQSTLHIARVNESIGLYLVPLASVPAVEMCCVISAAGMISSALLTQ